MEKKIRLFYVAYLPNKEISRTHLGDFDDFQSASRYAVHWNKTEGKGDHEGYCRFWMDEQGLWEDYGNWSCFFLYEGATIADLC